MRQLTDSSGSLTRAQSFEPYGEIHASAGTAATSYGYTGEWTDATGLVHLRARYLNTGVGRFTSRDTWEGDYSRPLSLNRWAYVEGNPINFTDPNGNLPISIDAVNANKFHFLNNKGFIKSLGLHPTTVAAGIAVQTRFNDKGYDEAQDPEDCDTGIGPSATNKTTNYGGYCESSDRNYEGYKNIVAGVNDELNALIHCQYPTREEINLFSWDHAIKSMALRMAASTVKCPSCDEYNKLIIAGMAQNGPGFELKSWIVTKYSDPHYAKPSDVTNINWEWYFSENSKPAEGLKKLPLRWQAWEYGGDWDRRYMLARFTANLQALYNDDSSFWKLPPGINLGDLNRIHTLTKTGL